MPVSAGHLNFSQRILERLFDGNIVNIRNECLFSVFIGI